MLEKVINRRFYLNHHLQAPLLSEREACIEKMHKKGLSRAYMLGVANYLLRIVEFLNLTDTDKRRVSLTEIETAGKRWSETIKNHPMKRTVAETSRAKFILIAVNWLSEIGLVDERYESNNNLLSALFSRAYYKRRYLTSPLLEERLSYLIHWKNRGATTCTMRHIANFQLHVMEYLHLTEVRKIADAEIVAAAQKWETVILPGVNKQAGREWNKVSFIKVARGWLGYIGAYSPEKEVPSQYDYVESYLDHLIQEKGYSALTRKGRDSILKIFLRHLEEESIRMEDVTAVVIDKYLEKRSTNGCGRRAIAGNASILRDFFGYAEQNGWCRKGLRESITSARYYRQETLPSFIMWEDVKAMIAHNDQSTPSGIRDNAILLLLSVYGLRRGEVSGMKLNDIDWRREVIYLKRVKGCRPQEMPLLPYVGDAIIRYLKEVRQNVSGNEHVFLCMRAPYRKMSTAAIYRKVSAALRNENLSLNHYGPHSLRHSCATHLVNSGHTMKEVADLLGHQMLDTTRIYAKVDLVSLRKVADMNWEGVL